jgi:hypothetical protein
VRRLKQFEQENARLKKLVAERGPSHELGPLLSPVATGQAEVPRRRPRKRIATGRPRPQALTDVNRVWSYDFVFDWCANGQQLKCLTVTDEWTKEGLANRGRRPHPLGPGRCATSGATLAWAPTETIPGSGTPHGVCR